MHADLPQNDLRLLHRRRTDCGTGGSGQELIEAVLLRGYTELLVEFVLRGPQEPGIAWPDDAFEHERLEGKGERDPFGSRYCSGGSEPIIRGLTQLVPSVLPIRCFDLRIFD